MSVSDDIAGVIAPPPLLFGAALATGLVLDFLVFQVPTGLAGAVRFGLATAGVLTALVLISGALTGSAGPAPLPSPGIHQLQSSPIAYMATREIRCTSRCPSSMPP